MNRVYLSDAENLRYVSSGVVSKGSYLQKDLNGSISPRNHLVEIPADVQFYLPSMPETAETFEMLNKEISEQVGSVLNNGSKSLAIKFLGAIFNFFSKNKQDVKKLNSSKDPYFQKWVCELLTTIVVPTASVRIENNTRCKLSAPAMLKLQTLERSFEKVGFNDDFVRQCDIFFREFGSHYFIGTYHLGGLRKDTRTENIKETIKGEDETKSTDFSTVDINYDRLVGFSSNDQICNWKRSLVGKPSNWCVIDKEESSAMNYCAVWNLIDAVHFKKQIEFCNALQRAWKKITGLSINPEIDGTTFIFENQIKAIEKNTEKDIFLLKLTEKLSILKGRKITVSDIILDIKNNQAKTRISRREETKTKIASYETEEDSEIITSRLFEEYLIEFDKTGDIQDSISKLLERGILKMTTLTHKKKVIGQDKEKQNSNWESNQGDIEHKKTYPCHPNCNLCNFCIMCPICCKATST